MKENKRKNGRKLKNLTRESEQKFVERKIRNMYSYPMKAAFFMAIIILIDIFLLVWIGTMKPAYKSNLTHVLSYGKPFSSTIIYIFLNVILPIVASRVIVKMENLEHKAIKTITFQLICNVVAIFIVYNSYYIVTTSRIYSKSFFKENVYTLQDIKKLKIEISENKGKKYCDLIMDLKSGKEIEILPNANGDFEKSSEFVKFDKESTNAKRYIDKDLKDKYKSILVRKFGEENTNYIIQNYEDK
ncbi:hypothetical protein [Clostridium felsineum]|uniref:hypothetical protein n=1 Tax=Clostridium felsineum TaxID=36839 RepID=UPI00098C6D32|nr:hypothetical protein [Clostridium felsineum]URZ03844.1 hypothetical protein CLAUR_039090 [Clostridium felsineum]